MRQIDESRATRTHNPQVPRLTRILLALVLAFAPTVVVLVSSASPANAVVSCHAWPSTYLKKENAKRGSSGWRNVTAVTATTAQFWLDKVSAGCGEQVGVHLAAGGTTHFQLWRLGWYAGNRGRLIRSWNATPGTPLAPPPSQPPASMTTAQLPPSTTAPGPLSSASGAPAPADSYPTYAGASATAWPLSTSFSVTPDMAPGLYLLMGAGPDGVATGAPLVVRDDLGPHALTIVAPTLTWQAYNKWGNADLYAWPNADGTVGGSAEADVVTFNRPVMNIWAHAELLGQEKGFLQLVNREGLDVTWVASQDLQRPQAVLSQTRALVMSRHDEYWTTQMRATTVALVRRGVNLIDLGGNNMYHAGKFLDSSLRWYEVRKSNNPLHAHDPAYKMSYRFVDAPTSNPQARLIGENFNCISHWTAFKVSDPNFWAWRAQKLRKGRLFPNIVGSESDGPSAGYARGTVFGSLSRIYCVHVGDYRLAGTSYRVTASRAGILDIGSMNWLCHLTTAKCGDYPITTAAGRQFVTKTTLTILRAAARGPLGRTYPAVGGVKPPMRPTYSRWIR